MKFANMLPLYEGLFSGEVVSELTEDLDKIAGFRIHPGTTMKHYVDLNITDINELKSGIYDIKVTNIKIGEIEIIKIDNEFIINGIKIYQDPNKFIHYNIQGIRNLFEKYKNLNILLTDNKKDVIMSR